MKRMLSLLVIFLLLFTYSIPAYADDNSDDSNVGAEVSNIVNGSSNYIINERDDDYIYINFKDRELVKFYVADEEFYDEGNTENQYLDIANKDGELFGVKNDDLYNISNNENEIRPLHGNSINTLVYNSGYFYYIKNTPHNNGNEELYQVNEDPNSKKKVIDVGYKSAGDIVAFGGDLYFTTTLGKIIKIDISKLNDGMGSSDVVSVVKNTNHDNIYGLAVADGSIFIGYGNKVVRLDSNFDETNYLYEFNGDMEIYGMAQGGKGRLSPPVASNVMISGTPRLGQTLTGSYEFSDPDGDDEGNSQYKWYLDGNEISGADSLTLEITEDMINGEIEFEVLPVSVKKPTDGDAVKSRIVTIEEPNLWITVDDGYELYVNGTHIGNDPVGDGDPDDYSWKTIDYYYIDPAVDKDDILIAVKGSDQDEGYASISGFVLGYKDSSGQWLITDENWKIFYNDEDIAPEPYNDGENSYEWYQTGYRSDDWVAAHEIEELDSDWPVVADHDYLGGSGAKWIWSDTYKVNQLGPVQATKGREDTSFDSPVYFRTMVSELPRYYAVNFEVESGMGSLVATVDGIEIDSGDLVEEGEDILFIPTPDSGYEISNWWLDNVSLGVANASYTVENLSAAVDVKVAFEESEEEPTYYAVTFEVESGMGSLVATVDGIEIDSGDLVEEGEDILFTPTPDSGYEISNWWLDNVSLGVANASYTVENLSAAVDVKVAFEESEEEPTYYAVNFEVESGMGSLVATVDGIEINSGDLVEEGEDILFTPTPDSGYEISNWWLDNVSLGVANASYTVENLSAAVDVKVAFEESEEQPTSFIVTYSSTGNGQLIGESTEGVFGSGIDLLAGSSIEFTATPGSGSEISHWIINGEDILETTSTYIVSSLNGTLDVKVVFVEADAFEVTFSVLTGMGTIEAMIDSMPISSGDMVDEGEDIIFTATPNAGYEITDWLLNNVSLESTTTSQAVVSLSANTDVKVSFTGPPVEPNFYTVNFSTPGNGSISANVGEGSIATGDSVEEESEVVFTASANSGYRVDYWRVDDVIVNSISTTYTINSLGDDVTVEVIFEEIPETTTTTGGGGGGGGSTSSVNAVSDRFTIGQNQVLEIETSELMANDDNVDSFESVESAVDGTVSLDGTTVTFIPDLNFLGRAYFNYTVEGDGDTDNGLVIIDVVEGVEIDDETTPLGSGDPDAFIIIEPDIVPLGVIDYSLPYIIGYPDKTFRPEREVTRAEMATIFARILSLDLTNIGEPMYDDISEDDWYYKYVQAVTRVGLFSGYEGNMFKPNRQVTHAEIAAAFSRYWELKNIEIETNGDSYTDIEGHWAQEMINRLYNAGISASYANGEFKPDAFTTRTELVVMVNRSLNRAEMIRETPSFADVLRSFWGFGAIEAATGYQEPESVQLD